ncbi:MAG TPA: vitamin K epoxide reductase family protein [Thermoplasmata archaeon]|nr:vitamin K epoxide reductase family protein [Thermoplasmata archaeon]
MRTRDIRSVIYLAGGLGLIVSIYTYIETVQSGLQKYCTINSYVSCGAVANSGRTTTLGIPDSFIGIGGFVVILLIAALAERRRKEMLWPYLLFLVTTAGVAFSLYFLYVEVGEIHALCPVCLSAWVFGWIAWAGTVFLVRKLRAKALARVSEKGVEAPSKGPSTSASSPP